jgi:hypothetical protein
MTSKQHGISGLIEVWISMASSSAIQVLQQSADQLDIVDPPRYTTAVLTILIAVALIAIFIFKRRPGVPLSWLQIAIPAAMALVGIVFLASRTWITLSHSSGTLVIAKQFFGKIVSVQTIRLNDIDNAVVESRSGPKHIDLALWGAGPLGNVFRTGRPLRGRQRHQ